MEKFRRVIRVIFWKKEQNEKPVLQKNGTYYVFPESYVLYFPPLLLSCRYQIHRVVAYPVFSAIPGFGLIPIFGFGLRYFQSHKFSIFPFKAADKNEFRPLRPTSEAFIFISSIKNLTVSLSAYRDATQ